MGQNKLENQIKEKLDSREIQPSAQAWDRLDAMLSVNEEKKTKRSFGWLYIAASITVLLLAGMFFFSQESTKTDPQNNVVETEVKKDVQKEAYQSDPADTRKNQQNQVAVSTEIQNPKSHKTSPNKEAVSIINQNKSSNNPLINREKQIEFQNSSDVAIKDLPQIETRKEIIVYNPKENKSTAPTDEQLLAGLDKKAKESTNSKSALKVDARSLLSQVDGELEMTFREKVISKVAKNYKEVKVALANRNNE
jgi:hypothetical protein